ncbi:ADP-ribosylation factor-like protein 9 [Boleophthalmus pectinirostris]|uniref:ADP-ribosylation factor-like protein 9 n=1 Tax=Boleophthalmus pectinirostris TaxID=150288 RepID=UPI0024300B54|nr:ADP-ribosylation factor-like protein 9 [Boleophthalmus pectinirostris]
MVGLRGMGVLGASVVIAGGVAYLVWNYHSKRKTPEPPAKEAEKTTEESSNSINQGGDGDEGVKVEVIQSVSAPVVATELRVQSTAVSETVKPRGTQVLVLGLDGAGKTSLLHSFTNSWSGEEPQPTQGLNAVSISREDLSIEFLEIGGSVELRQYWLKYMPKALMLVYVVDASNPQLFPLAKSHLHEILVTEPHLPLMVLANKQDCAGACTITDLHEALSLSELGDRKLFVIGTYVTKDMEEPSSAVEDALEIIVETIQTPR